NQPNDRGLARAGRADQRGHRSWTSAKGNVVQNGFRLLVGKGDVLEGDLAANLGEHDLAVRVFVLGRFVQDLTRAFQTGNRFGDLRSNTDHLKQRRGEIAEEHGVGEEPAECELA